MNNQKFFVITGPSAAGKTSLMNEILGVFGDRMRVLPSVTTKDPSETNPNSNYTYVSKEEFEEGMGKGRYLEWSNHYGSYYGTDQVMFHEYLETGSSLVKAMNVVGALGVQEEVEENVVVIYVDVPSEKELQSRMLKRDGKLDLLRIVQAEDERQYVEQFNYVVLNDDFSKAKEEILEIVEKELNLVTTEV